MTKLHALNSLNVVVAVPSMSTWHAEFAMCLIGMIGYFNNTRVKNAHVQQLRVVNSRGSILPNLRLEGLKAAKAHDASHILWIDSDHEFPVDLLNRLLAREKDVVAINHVTKTFPACPTGRSFSKDNSRGEVVFTDPASTGLEKVWRIGTGTMLMSKRAYSQVPHEAFGMIYEREADSFRGEDWGLCAALEEVGCPIYVDHDLSLECSHIGNFRYSHEFVGQVVKD